MRKKSAAKVKDQNTVSASPTPEPKKPAGTEKNVETTETTKTTKTSKPAKVKTPRTTKQKIFLAIIIVILVALIAAITVIILLTIRSKQTSVDQPDHPTFPDPIYSTLTGQEISDAKLNSNPTLCVQIPNGKDGARPQAGLSQAAVVFEAIAETGITRFAAVFQNSTVSAIGPIRSLRPYYLEWDIPFDCTVVHAGGSDEALAALRKTGQRELDESNVYMWREYQTGRGWNNLFTSSEELIRYNSDKGYNSSNIKAFAHFTPEEVEQILIDHSQDCTSEEPCETDQATEIKINFGAMPSYNTVYHYDAATNTYPRSYANGESHLTFTCPAELNRPNTTTQCGEASQVAPSVVIAMVVNETTMADGYHEDITTTGTGTAYIFQNGEAIEGSWSKASANEQIVFKDNSGNIVKLSPGQLWIAAVPSRGGSVNW